MGPMVQLGQNIPNKIPQLVGTQCQDRPVDEGRIGPGAGRVSSSHDKIPNRGARTLITNDSREAFAAMRFRMR